MLNIFMLKYKEQAQPSGQPYVVYNAGIGKIVIDGDRYSLGHS